jgi:osmoprotectant transport system permease protein
MRADRTMKWLGIALLVIALLSPRFFIVRPNRIVDGLVLGSWEALEGVLPLMMVCLLVVAAAVFPPNKWVSGLMGLAASVVAAVLLIHRTVSLSEDLGSLTFPDTTTVINPALSLGVGWYLMLAGLFFLTRASLMDLAPRKWLANLVSFSIYLLPIFFLAQSNRLDHISIYIELSRNWGTILYELGRHLKLSLTSVLVGFFLSLGLGIFAYRHRNFENVIFKLINFAQVVPTLSLLALFMIPLTYLSNHFQWIKDAGISGIGFAPAFIVLVLYSLLPITSNILTSLKGTRQEIMESAKGMGMTEKQILWKVQFPLSVKPIFAGFRLATLQAIGNCILAGLIGGGGLGSLIFLGLAQSAPDMVLGASFMVVAVAAIADLLLRGGEHLISLKYRGGYD